ncbi:MAG TPA: hypothetical protein VNT20_18770 [Flavisolibacter sp.]|jgi:hypothetical protein|nr:hypothetical protein [Flavisolibacter sp.]
MAVFFQNIPDDEFNAEADFVVKESKNMNLFVGVLFLVFSLIAFPMSVIMGGVTFFMAIGAFARSAKDITIIRINKNGFYYCGKLITDWDHFISEEFIDELPLPQGNDRGINDKFFLFIKYYKDGKPGYFGRKIRLTDSQDKSEEGIIAAIKFYYKKSREVVK